MKKYNKLKTLIAGAVLSAGILLVSPSISEAKYFTDLNQNGSHVEGVTYLNELNAFDYKTGSKLNGNASVSRAEVSTILYNLYKDKISKVRTYNNEFKDVTSKSAHSKEIIWSYEMGIFDGDVTMKFNPNNKLTRAQMSKILVNTFWLEGKGTATFKDVSSKHWAYEFVSILGSNGVTNGDGKGNYLPNNNVTLNQLSSFIYRIATTDDSASTIDEIEAKDDTDDSASTIDIIEEKVVELVNAERAKHGLQALQADVPLMVAAREKSQDMKNHNYFSHTSPTFGSPFDHLDILGISYTSAGENIAKGQRTAEEVVTDWMNSEGHRANILNSNFTHIGVGYVKEGNIWTQQFIEQ